ncbi:MAG: ankyrin repeat domain-containing protein, partial [Gammaproteobacteria bacterium]
MLRGNLSDFGTAQDKALLLYQTIRDGDIGVVNELLSGPIINYSSIRNLHGESSSLIFLAVAYPQPDILRMLLECYKNEIARFEKGLALQYAAQNGYTAIVTTLLDQCGGEIDADYKHLAFACAAENGHTVIVTTLLDRCGDEISADSKRLALQFAAHNGRTTTVITLLVRCGDEISAYCKGEVLQVAAQNGRAAIVTALLERCGNDIRPHHKREAVSLAAQNGRLEALNELLANESVLALVTWGSNAALRGAQMRRNGTREGSEERARYDAVIARLIGIPAVAQLANQQANQENNLADIVNFEENSMQGLTKNESALVNHLKKHYEPIFEDKSWEVIRVEISSYLESEYQKSPARDGYHRICVLKSDSKIPVDFVPADTIGIHPVGNTLYWKSLDGTLNQKWVSKEQIEQLFAL